MIMDGDGGEKTGLVSDGGAVETAEPESGMYVAGGEMVSIKFEDGSDESRFVHMLKMCHGCVLAYLVTTAVTISSSKYTAREGANIDAILLACDVMTIDITSCFFVLGGFMAMYVYSSVGWESWKYLSARVVAQIFGDMWLSTLLILFVGSIDKVTKNRFYVHDVALTILEGVTGLRILDTKQSVSSPHTMNVSMWPVQSFVFCLLSVHGTFKTNEFIRRKFGDLANLIITVMALCGIFLFTLFAMMNRDTNIFYANATSVMYRMLEFNLGIHYFYLAEKESSIVVSCTRMLAQCSPAVYILFAATWWSEIGEVVERRPGQTCLRLYPRNTCLQDHHVFLLRGCVLGLTMLSTVSVSAPFQLATPAPGATGRAVRAMKVGSTAVALSWPVYIFIQLIFKISFSDELVFANSALVSFMMPAFLYGVSMVYTLGLQDALTDYVDVLGAAIGAQTRGFWDGVCGSVLAPDSTSAGAMA
tara:strand:+ start:5543 stop:6967 length:1425 start_codon:yes stop_codon:yes gene_type:complete